MPLFDRYLAKEILLPFGAGVVFLNNPNNYHMKILDVN